MLLVQQTAEELTHNLATKLPSHEDKPEVRNLTEEQQNALIQFLSKQPGKVLILSPMGDPEAFRFAEQISEVFEQARWSVRGGLSADDSENIHIMCRESTPNSSTTIASTAFVRADIAYEFRIVRSEIVPWDQCTIFVGRRA
jgi:hypothetical protein